MSFLSVSRGAAETGLPAARRSRRLTASTLTDTAFHSPTVAPPGRAFGILRSRYLRVSLNAVCGVMRKVKKEPSPWAEASAVVFRSVTFTKALGVVRVPVWAGA